MNIRSSVLVQLAFFVAAITYSLYMSQGMPDIVPTHWNAQGQPDGFGSKWTDLLLLPGTMLGTALLTVVLPRLSPKQFDIEPFEATYGYVFVLVGAMLLGVHIIIVRMASGSHLDMNKTMMAVLFGFFALMGNVIGRVKPNFYMGVRTPWTITDERVWHSTHRYAGRLWVWGGILGAILSLLGLPFWGGMTWLLLIAFAPVVKSYTLYKGFNP